MRGIVFVAAAGNDGRRRFVYPAGYDLDNIVSVAALDRHGNLAAFSNYSPNWVDIGAPGADILSTVPGGGYLYASGTSMAAPHVAGALALLQDRFPSWSHTQLIDRLYGTFKPAYNTLTGKMQYPGWASPYRMLRNDETPIPEIDPEKEFYTYEWVRAPLRTDIGQHLFSEIDGYASWDLDFSFEYYGKRYSKIMITSNGRVIPWAGDEPPPSTELYRDRLVGISVYHDRFMPDPRVANNQSGVFVRNLGNGSTLITWKVIHYWFFPYQPPPAEQPFQVTVQCIIHQDGTIETRYDDMVFGRGTAYNDQGASAVVGLGPKRNQAGIGKKLYVHRGGIWDREHFGGSWGLRYLPNRKNYPTVVRAAGGGLTTWLQDKDGDPEFEVQIVYGLLNDQFVAGDWNCNGQTTPGVVRLGPDNLLHWYLDLDGDPEHERDIAFGLAGDIAVAADWNNDGTTNPGVVRLGADNLLHWYLDTDGDPTHEIEYTYGLPGDIPVVGDWDGDGTVNIGVVRPGGDGLLHWFLDLDGDLLHEQEFSFGLPGDQVVTGDWDYDGITNLGVVREHNDGGLYWYLDTDGDPEHEILFLYGLHGDRAVYTNFVY